MDMIIYYRIYIEFLLIYFYRYLLGKYSNNLIAWHVKLTPSRSTEHSFREILLENIRYRQRKVEQKRWSLWLIMIFKAELLEINIDNYAG